MKNDSQITGILGNLIIHSIINKKWKSDWQKFDQENDDGIDGIIHVRKKGEITGEVIYAQVKSGSGYKTETKKRPNIIGINVSEEYINNHRPRWNSIKNAVILLFVDDDEKVYWCDIKSDKSYTTENKSIILIPKEQRFGSHSKGHFRKIGAFFPKDKNLTTIRIERKELKYLRIDRSLKECSRDVSVRRQACCKFNKKVIILHYCYFLYPGNSS